MSLFQLLAPRGEPAHHTPGHQGEQRAAGRGLRSQGRRLRVRQAHTRRRVAPDDAGEGHAGLPGAGVRHVGEGLGELRRLQLRRAPPGARQRAPAAREAPRRRQARDRAVGGAAGGPPQVGAHRGPAPRRAVRRAAAPRRGRGRHAVHAEQRREPAGHGRGGRDAQVQWGAADNQGDRPGGRREQRANDPRPARRHRQQRAPGQAELEGGQAEVTIDRPSRFRHVLSYAIEVQMVSVHLADCTVN